VSDHRLRCRNPNAHPYYGVYAEILLTASNFRGWRSTIIPVKGWIPSGYALHQISALTAALREKNQKNFHFFVRNAVIQLERVHRFSILLVLKGFISLFVQSEKSLYSNYQSLLHRILQLRYRIVPNMCCAFMLLFILK